MATEQNRYRVFASYSRRDAPLVQHLVSLLRAVDTGVFLDEQSIDAGTEWRAEIVSALEQCETLLVFWCEHSAQSEEVRKEYLLAISFQKRIVPVLIDLAAMPRELGRYQAVDLRRTVGGFHDILIKVLAYEESIRQGVRYSMTDEGYRSLLRDTATTRSILPHIEREFLTQARHVLAGSQTTDGG
jgi:hypothetical protein